MLVHTELAGVTPVAFVSIEALLIVAACLAVVGAVLTAWLVVRPDPAGPPDREDDEMRRSPSPASLGLDEDPIVAALGIGGKTKGPKP